MSSASTKRASERSAPIVDSDSSSTSGVWTIGRVDHEAIAYAVHDAKSVLGALVVNVDWLRGAIQDRAIPGAQEALDDVSICCSRLNNLLREALRSASGNPVRDGVASLRVSVLARRVVEGMRRQAEVCNVTIDLIEGQDALVLGEQGALERVLSNLLDNAIRFSRFGGRVVLSYGVEGGIVTMSVADEGPGVPVELQERVFEAFQTLGNGATQNGAAGEHTGLGLAFCRKVARAHGGDVRLSNRPVAGALFSVTLPALRGAQV
jgi:signal transduction histidine kinase